MPHNPEAIAPRPALPMRLTRLRVKNFRSIADIDIPLSPLTVLVGPNGSGKSNVVDALRFVRDVFARGLDQAVMDREGMGVIQRWGTEGIEIGLVFCIEEDFEVDFDYVGDNGEPQYSVYLKTPSTLIDYEFTIVSTANGEGYIERQELRLKVDERDFPQLEVVRKVDSISGKLGNADWVDNLEKRNFLSPKIYFPSGDVKLMDLLNFSKSIFYKDSDLFDFSSIETSNKNGDWWKATETLMKEFDDYVTNSNFYTLNPIDLRQPQQVVKESPFDEKGRNLAAVLRRIKRHDESTWPNLLFALQQAITGFDTLEIEPVGGYLATKLIYQTDTTQPRTSYLGQESDGTIRMLGILAALYQDPAQPFLSIEEPEANIHPGALAVLASVLDEASLRSQILVTTHSPDMLDHLPPESFLVVEKVGDTTHVGPLDASQLASVRKRLFTPGELLRMEGLHRQTPPVA